MKQLFSQITTIWTEGTGTQRALAALSLLVIIGGVSMSTWLAGRPDQALLYGNLEPADAAAVVEKIRDAGVDVELRDGGRSVYVPRDKVAEMRVASSSAGLPRGGGAGWELFDKSSFGVSDFEQSVRYKRAIEGELSRSISAFEAVETARVSITKPKRSPFVSEHTTAKASVVLKTRSGMELSRDNVAAVKHLIAGAVEGLDPDKVSVMDTTGRVLAEPGSDSVAQTANDQLELRREMERLVESKAQAMLDQVGVAAVVRVSLDIDFQRIVQTSETYAPEGQVERETIQNSKTRPASSGAAGPVGMEAKLQDGALPAGGPLAQSEDQETIETSYKIGRTVKSEELTSPVVRRMSLSLVLADKFKDNLATIQDIVKSAVGFDTTRGDQFGVMTHDFESMAVSDVVPEEIAEPAIWLSLVERGIQILGVLGALFLVLRLLKMADRKTVAARPAAARVDVEVGEDGEPVDETYRSEPGRVEERVPGSVGRADTVELNPGSVAHDSVSPSLQEMIKNTIKNDPDAATRVLQSWLRDGNLK